MRRTVSALFPAIALLAASGPALAADALPPESSQFDFWIGAWDVNLRMIQDDLSWKDSVRADARIYPILDGKAILELWDSEPIKGFSLRYFDPAREEWALWLNWPGKNRSGLNSLSGTFRHGRGDFFSTRKLEDGTERISRYSFNDIAPDRLRWDDAYSTDGGKTWTNNWIMEFTRRGSVPSLPPAGRPAHTWETGERCDREEFAALEMLAGARTGTVEWRDAGGAWQGSPALLVGYPILDGCAVMTFAEYERDGAPWKVFGHVTYNTYVEQYELGGLDNTPGGALERFFGERADGALVLVRGGDAAPKRRITIRPGDEGVLRYLLEVSADEGESWQPAVRATFD